MEIDNFLEKLKEKKPYLQEKFKVKEIGAFGSYVRREQDEESDLDILVDFEETPSLFKFLQVEIYLAETLGVKVDLVAKDSLKKRIGKNILQEVIYV